MIVSVLVKFVTQFVANLLVFNTLPRVSPECIRIFPISLRMLPMSVGWI